MKIYFAGSIRAGRQDHHIYVELITFLKKYGQILTEHLGDPNLSNKCEDLSEEFIHDRDMNWVFESNILIAEVTTPSLGVGYEIGRAIEHNIPVICLYKKSDKKLSGMLVGSKQVQVIEYNNLEQAKQKLLIFLEKLTILSATLKLLPILIYHQPFSIPFYHT